LDATFAALVLPAALVLGSPAEIGSYERGLFCESPGLIELVVELTDRGGDPARTVHDINKTLAHRACIYATNADVRALTVGFERNIAANNSVYAIYRVDFTALGRTRTEIGNLVWSLPRPLTMYTLREARPDQHADH
jgi:hypothetical protein